MEVRPGIHRLEVPLAGGPPGGVNLYLIRGTEGWLLLDTGWNSPDSFNALRNGMAEIGVSLSDIRQIVITHIHPDHFGLAGRLKEMSGGKVFIHSADSSVIRSRYVEIDGLLDDIAGLLRRNGVPEIQVHGLGTASLHFLKLVVPAEPDVLLSGGETISTGEFDLEVLWTPGHSRGQICLYERRQKLLFSGDHVMPQTTCHIGLHPESGPNPLDDYLESLRRIRGLDVDLVLPAHEAMFANLSERIDRIVAHHKRRDEAILRVLGMGLQSAFEVAQKIPWMLDSSPNGVRWEELNPLDKRLAVMEAMAHLEALRFRGKVRRGVRGGIVLYRLS